MENNNQTQNDNKTVNDSSQKQNRFKSKAAWVAAAALMLFILKTYGLLAPIGFTEESYKELTTLIFAVLTAFGIFNDPTNKESL
ncbi:phage holin [uncultured Clostridium sp.]|uniref:phage holin n=1 Tax=uncultured Clostridium sp. TaxID=59620 RepID=UPI0025F56194|nr:phage holin [uncultured Clostridium sp.]